MGIGVAVLAGVCVAVGVAVSVGVREISGVSVAVTVDDACGVMEDNRTMLVPEAGFFPSFTKHPARANSATATSNMIIALKIRLIFKAILTSTIIKIEPCFDYRRESIEINNKHIKKW